MTLPTSRDIPNVARSLSNGAHWLGEHGADALTAKVSRAPRERNDGYRLASMREGDGGRSTVSEGPAVAFADRELELGRMQTRLRERIAQVEHDTGEMVREIVAIQEFAGGPKAKAPTSDRTDCAELYCEDESDGRNGRCDACMQQLYRKANTSGQPWSAHSPLPRSYFEERESRRSAAKARAEGRKGAATVVVGEGA